MNRFFSAVAAAFLAVAAWAVGPSGSLPVMYVNTENGQEINSKENYLQASYWLDPMGVQGVEAFGSKEAPLQTQIRGRGNYTWTGFEKKPYRLKLTEKQPLLGMNKSKHFALLAHADDNIGFLRNPVGFEASRLIGLPWTPAQQPVELVLNGDYRGLYFLTETIRVDKDRVNIVEQADQATTDVDGGWLVEIDNYDSDPHVTVPEGTANDYDIWFTYKSPEVLSPEQEAFLQQQMSQINAQVYSDNPADCTWADLVDLESLAKFYIVQELVDNYESFHGSCYMTRQRGEAEKWNFGPVWDFGSSLNGEKNQFIYQGREHHQVWIGQMCKFNQFMDVVRSEWRKFYSTNFNTLLGYVDDFSSSIARAAVNDHERWANQGYGTDNEAHQADRVKSFLTGSAAWLAKQWGGSPEPGTTAKVYFLDDQPGVDPWQQVYVYSWGDQGNLYFGDWPGSPMTRTTIDGKEGWEIEFEYIPGKAKGIIFNNGGNGEGNQTADLQLIPNVIYHRDGSTSTAGIADITTAPEALPITYYTLQGQRIANPRPGTLCIMRQGSRAWKAIIP